jgi:nesprin-1
LRHWLEETEAQLPQELELRTTLDEKRSKLQSYRALLHDALSHQQDIVNLRDKIESLPEKTEKIDQMLTKLTKQHSDILKRAQVSSVRSQHCAVISLDMSRLITAVLTCQSCRPKNECI